MYKEIRMSCLFRSLAYFVHSVDEHELRQIICNYLEKNPTIMDDLSLKDILHIEGMETADYVQNMRNRSTWGGAIEIKAFCEIYQVGVIVRVRQTQRDIIFKPSSMEHVNCLKAVVIEWQGFHYEPINSTS